MAGLRELAKMDYRAKLFRLVNLDHGKKIKELPVSKAGRVEGIKVQELIEYARNNGFGADIIGDSVFIAKLVKELSGP